MRIIGFAGSLRSASYNKMALKLVLQKAKEAGAETEFVDLKELNIPLYDGDLEKEIQLPDGIKLLREKIEKADGVVIATPEYNHSLPGVLKNTIDWLSRTKYFPSVLTNKPFALFGASDGNFATVRAQIAFYPIANTLELDLMPSKTYVGNVEEVFDENGKCLDPKVEERLTKFAQKFIQFIQK